jgi:hypothetical protein
MDAAFTEQHVAAYSDTCLSCHTGSEALADFDHGAVFALDGAHGALSCGTCHAGRRAQDLTAGCAACHREPEIHRGRFGDDCAACHTALGWLPASLRYHAFPLEHGSTGEVACRDCHPEDYVSYSCTICHEHEQAQIERQHREANIDGLDGGIQDLADCARCHPRGEVQEDG